MLFCICEVMENESEIRWESPNFPRTFPRIYKENRRDSIFLGPKQTFLVWAEIKKIYHLHVRSTRDNDECVSILLRNLAELHCEGSECMA